MYFRPATFGTCPRRRLAAAMRNVQSIFQMSAQLAAAGTAHVIPDSMGGAAATARLLREGVTVTGSVMVGEKFILSGLSDEDIEEVAKFLDIQYDRRELRLVYRDPEVEGGVFRWKVDGDKLIAISSAFRVMWIEGRW